MWYEHRKQSKFLVLDNDRPACYPKNKYWKDYSFSSLEDAFEYAKQWLGGYCPSDLSLNQLIEGYRYSESNDKIQIIEVVEITRSGFMMEKES